MTLLDKIVVECWNASQDDGDSGDAERRATKILAIVRAEVEPALQFAIRAHPDIHAGGGAYVKDTLRPMLERSLAALRGQEAPK